MVRFIHTSDWQLGMARRFLSADAQARFTAARVDAIRTIGRVAREHGAAFVVVAGDVFDSNLVERQLVLRAIEALREAEVPFYLLPGNHDPLDASSVFRSRVFAENCPANVTVLDGGPVEAEPGVWLVPAPWRAKKWPGDTAAAALERAAVLTGTKIVVAHGGNREFTPEVEYAALVDTANAEKAIASGAVQYVALGDRHSRTPLGETGRIWYSGAPEPTEYRELDPGLVLDVLLEDDRCEVTPVKVAEWRFTESIGIAFDSEADLTRLRTWLDGLPAKERTIMNLGFTGTITMALEARLEEALDHYKSMFAAIERRPGDSQLVVMPSESDFSSLHLDGFAATAAAEIGAAAGEAGPAGEEAREALRLLHRLAGSVS